MSREVYDEGRDVGRRAVRRHLEAVFGSAGIEDLGRLAGRALDALSATDDFTAHHAYGRTESWRMGFIDGFLDRSTEIRERRGKS